MLSFLYSPIVADLFDTSNIPKANPDTALPTALNIVFAIAASVAMLVIVIAGFRYIVARGDARATADAKNTIIYALIGLVITMAAYSIVTFVIKGVS